MLLVTESLTLMAGKAEPPFLGHLVQALHAGGGLLGNAPDLRKSRRVPLRVGLQARANGGKQRGLLLARGPADQARIGLGAGAEVQQERRIAAVIQDHVGVAPVRPLEDAVGIVPVVHQRLALPGKHRRARGGDGGGGVVLGGEDVARGPAHLGTERLQRLDQHRGLDGHVQRAGDARPFQRAREREFLANRHETGHLGLGDGDLLAPPGGERQVRDLEVSGSGRFECGVHTVLREDRASAVWMFRVPLSLAGGPGDPGRPVATLLSGRGCRIKRR